MTWAVDDKAWGPPEALSSVAVTLRTYSTPWRWGGGLERRRIKPSTKNKKMEKKTVVNTHSQSAVTDIKTVNTGYLFKLSLRKTGYHYSVYSGNIQLEFENPKDTNTFFNWPDLTTCLRDMVMNHYRTLVVTFTFVYSFSLFPLDSNKAPLENLFSFYQIHFHLFGPTLLLTTRTRAKGEQVKKNSGFQYFSC